MPWSCATLTNRAHAVGPQSHPECQEAGGRPAVPQRAKHLPLTRERLHLGQVVLPCSSLGLHTPDSPSLGPRTQAPRVKRAGGHHPWEGKATDLGPR